jgi:hypothetical protein
MFSNFLSFLTFKALHPLLAGVMEGLSAHLDVFMFLCFYDQRTSTPELGMPGVEDMSFCMACVPERFLAGDISHSRS